MSRFVDDDVVVVVDHLFDSFSLETNRVSEHCLIVFVQIQPLLQRITGLHYTLEASRPRGRNPPSIGSPADNKMHKCKVNLPKQMT